jgi:hypothetical protein
MGDIKDGELTPLIVRVSPTKVRKTPRDLPQTGYTQRNTSFSLLPKSDGFQAANFGGVIPTESRSLSSEESYSPSRLVLPGHDPAVCDGLEQDLPGFRSPEVAGLSSVATVWEDAIDYIYIKGFDGDDGERAPNQSTPV